MDFLSPDDDFNLLSLHDLLVARDQFHLHLIHKPNVIGTAVGRYRIRKADPWPDRDDPNRGTRRTQQHRPARTLQNSEVRPYSWPAILVFVRQWVDAGDFSHPEDAVPPAVYLATGSRVPICVVQADRDDLRPEGAANYNYPASVIGGGYPVVCEVQGREHVASIGCLVTDGHRTYALTNRHVAGEAGSPIYSIIGGNKERIGSASPLQLTRADFSTLYPGWPGQNVFVDLDVGLIDLDDLNRWTTQVYGIGEIGELADLDASNLSLRLVGRRVRAFGAASREMSGEVCALFYRFKSVGGFEYVSDLLIGPHGDGQLGTHPGDSGTLWLIDAGTPEAAPSPLALQWGGQVFLGGSKGGSSYALATLLSTVCNSLDVTLLRDWNTGLPEYWGAVGHYSIASKAVDKIHSAKLKRLMTENLARISFDLGEINKKTMAGLSKRDFVPLADVPDMVWKVGPYKRGGMSSPEHANHFADMDRRLTKPLAEGATLLEICDGKPENVAAPVWQRYYDAVQTQFPAERESRGLLPFRVWQIYDAMVSFVKAGEVEKFVCAAGVLSHYVGDACQPLHISYMFNGDPDRMVPGTVRDPKTGAKSAGTVPEGTGVHAVYEDEMVDAHVPEIMQGIDQRLAAGAAWKLVTGGHGAAVAVVGLMQKTFAAIAPREIIDTFLPVADEKPAQRAVEMWRTLGSRTIDVMADGCFCLAELWDSAWKEGGGDTSVTRFDAVDEATLERLYRNPEFLRSYTLKTIEPVLQAALPQNGGAAAPVRRRSRAHA
ncbi:MAG: hypothetical protein JWL84_2985 [Rhodospirillales bacterium]|nr:hypothetical protein [Rhodospirillales bacterium]